MANPWFRLYAEFANDPKVQMLSEINQRRLVMLFCFRCNSDVTLHDEEVAFQLRVSNEEWLSTKAIFVDRGFTDNDNNVLNWDKRQFTSDTSKNRVAAYRERKRNVSNVNVTLQKQESNAIDTDTEQIHIKKKPLVRQAARFEDFWGTWPNTDRKTAKGKCLEKWKAKNLDAKADLIIAHIEAMKKTRKWQDGFEPSPMTYINQNLWTDEVIDNERKQEPKGAHVGMDDETLLNICRVHKIATGGLTKAQMVSKINAKLAVR